MQDVVAVVMTSTAPMAVSDAPHRSTTEASAVFCITTSPTAMVPVYENSDAWPE